MPQTLKALREEARKCQACALWANATQTVFGTGSPPARVMLVGEQPGDFKWEPRGKRRLHKTPAQREVDACHQWRARALATVKPHVVACLGATAAKAVIGKDFKVSTQRGQFVASGAAPYVFATLHPLALLRLRGDAEREAAFAAFVKDLKLIARALSRP
jgi:DNA polymerase